VLQLPDPDDTCNRRTFSSANLEDVQKLLDARESALKVDARSPPYFAGTYAKSTFALPCLQQNPRLEEAVIDHCMRASLESRGLINWWVDGGSNLVRLYPLDTLSDGNCLLHALSLALCGTHDRRLTLRTALHATMKGEHGHIFRQRWQLVQTARNKAEGFELEQHQWDREWQTLVDRAGTPGSSLEDVHILTLAHVLSRPIIVYSSKVLEGVEGDAVAPVQVGVCMFVCLCVCVCARTHTHTHTFIYSYMCAYMYKCMQAASTFLSSTRHKSA